MFNQARNIAQLETDLVAVEDQISQLRSEQLVLVNELDRAQAPQSDASRSMAEWVQAHLDVKKDTATDLVFAARSFGKHRALHNRMLYQGATFDRTIAAVRLAEAGATSGVVEESYGHDLAGVTRLAAQTRHITPTDERRAFADRFFTIQPNLDESTYRLWGEAPGLVGRTIEKAICQRADELRRVARDLPSSRSQRQLDALATMAQDTLDAEPSDEPGNSGLVDRVTVFIDAEKESPAETSAEIEYGPRVGPNSLEELLCGARIQVVGLNNGLPVVTSPATRAIPPAIRQLAARRDGGCVIDGCNSRYRLEPHHIVRYADGGTHHPDNLATLCWYHHHIAIHGNGYSIDAHSPPRRRRLTRHDRHDRSDPP